MLPREGQVKGVHHHEALIIRNAKGTYLRKRRSKLGAVKLQQTQNYQQMNLKEKKNNENEN